MAKAAVTVKLPQAKYFFKAGDKIHDWTIVQKIPDDTKTRSPNLVKRWRVECKCGKRETIPQYYLTRANPKQHCGCGNKSLKTHYKQEYQIWYMCQQRCHNPAHVSFKDYGGRGIKVCDEWRDPVNGFAKFLKHIGPRPSKKYSMDRIDNDGNYEPGNVRWATSKEQAANRGRKPKPISSAPEAIEQHPKSDRAADSKHPSGQSSQ